jgi:hypothetical protein
MNTAASAEVTAGRRVAAAREMAPARGVTAAAAAPAPAPVASATAAVLGKRRCGADQDRPQDAGCQKKATALGTHDCHLPLRVAPLHAPFKTHQLIRPTVYNAVQAVRCTAITALAPRNRYVNYT